MTKNLYAMMLNQKPVAATPLVEKKPALSVKAPELGKNITRRSLVPRGKLMGESIWAKMMKGK